jgi:hypothetical protein
MKSNRSTSHIAWTAPAALLLPFLMGAKGDGCAPGGPVFVGSGSASDGGPAVDGSSSQDGGSTGDCLPSSCTGPQLADAKLCPDGTSVGETLCAPQANGQCGWTFPACPTDACVALPCAALLCEYGTLETTQSDGCPGCGECAPPPGDAGLTSDACPSTLACNLPDCIYGVIPQKDAQGCALCAICAPAPDGGGPFACVGYNDGGVITCDGATQYCSLIQGGAIDSSHPPACDSLPSQCLSDRTCACLDPQGGGTACTTDASGNLTLTLDAP